MLRNTVIRSVQLSRNMSSFTQPTPIVACGRSTATGKLVSQHLLPEYEVIHFIQSVEAAEAELPHLLAGRDPQSRYSNELGTHDYSRPPRAVIFGRGYEPQQVEELKEKFAGVAKEPVAWVRGNPADVPAGGPGPDYAQKVAADMKQVLKKWRDAGAKDEETLVY
ncbi:hypothetical protein KXW98_005273 [Aspergillus fumigatus]|uniref:Uncharacterized protein n=3 Tax=Aspergillus fumigatus TaxID=746128 RepID=Q4W913_ASPFU|nr:conserved hypothetical protein [Aspergillus fumigatus Af293]EDP47834.1 conserved hypothetical protein [Aspergillus fumigatus A1163]KAF4254187.1 hypothetical protein CNMCM8714_005412 [Aspergillus fumigatus]EAL84206.1 conserved hypothetical protein [Aspergillus fumigatus Af293]KAF4258550.1 hypothetical protein CNMCM8057_003126 [Aspergillus fumigatus]KAF4284421.1 hypothetical protein CNMCM8689_006141 [Aspergillus fumigatus]